MTRLLIVCLTLLWIHGIAAAQSALDATVVTVSGRSVYISAGRDAGVIAGARVVFRLKTGEVVTATIVDVSATNARAELPEEAPMPEPQDKAAVEIVDAPQDDSAATGTKPAAPRPVPAHPLWQQPVGARDPNAPLLSPAFSARPQDQPTTIRGRSYSTIRVTRDIHNDNNYLYARSGLWLEVRNPLGDGGIIRFQGDAQYRNTSGQWTNSNESDTRIQRFSYAWGTDKNAPFRGEVGRFFSVWLPELGIIDGGEGALRLENGLSVGAGLGYYPSTPQGLYSSDAYGFHVFADYQPDDAKHTFEATIGYQQTYWDHNTDRSLVIARVTANPTDDIRLFTMAMVDLYGSEDTLKSNSADLTQLISQASFRFTPTTGATASLIHTTWPELQRTDMAMPPELVADGYVDRLSGTFWTKLDENWRLSLRSQVWRDQSREGYGGEASLDWTLNTEAPSSIYGAVYYEDSAYTTGTGLRLQAQTQLGAFRLFAGYDGFYYTTDTVTPGGNDYLRHTLRADVSWGEGSWYWDIDTSYSFGNDEESISIGVSLQHRF